MQMEQSNNFVTIENNLVILGKKNLTTTFYTCGNLPIYFLEVQSVPTIRISSLFFYSLFPFLPIFFHSNSFSSIFFASYSLLFQSVPQILNSITYVLLLTTRSGISLNTSSTLASILAEVSGNQYMRLFRRLATVNSNQETSERSVSCTITTFAMPCKVL